MKRKSALSKAVLRRRDPKYRARQMALLKGEVEADCRALLESIKLVIRELRSWK